MESATKPIWTRRSSRCDNDHCVTVSRHNQGVDVFDSISPGTVLSFPESSWHAFLLGLGTRKARTSSGEQQA
ncbi:DUF397 domain-containing protein [Micromonospora sp. WMMD1120]|uniref:DUF397 domain-containing protein n=1 Tax=Micromonospora sp. WMMD1120 TaxID=3016106 RepID=UPI00241629BA|nr:DUF397 domain-containing protein [Micromonospora sp. WMMD1120]MDG4807649.1 DUF397 domain-containing protein [Micromonospora sp. WMMD1120]